MSEVTSEGRRLIESWLAASQALEYAKSRLHGADCGLRNAHDALAKWLLPDDAKPGEKIAVWHGDSLIQVTVGEPDGRHIVTVRTRGKRGLRP